MPARSLGECLGENVTVLGYPAAFLPGCLAMVVKPHRAWIPMLRSITPGLTYCKWRPPGQPFDST